MAHTVAFNFRTGDSLLHRLDPRFKVIFLALISLSALRGGPAGLGFLSLFFTGLIVNIRLPVTRLASELRYFGLFLSVIFVARCLTEPGDVLFTYSFITVTYQGILEGSLAAWRLALIIVMGLLFSVSTRPKEIRTAVEILFARVPLVPEKRIAVMIGLIVRFIPVILHVTQEVLDAQRARAVEQRKNPIYRASNLALPIMRRTVDRAEQLTCAMEARCFNENRPTPPLTSTRLDWWGLMATLSVCLVLILA
ncbi:MAG: energy-coupling factor transporter transmembrane component T family protein [Desulforhopalus sp.]